MEVQTKKKGVSPQVHTPITWFMLATWAPIKAGGEGWPGSLSGFPKTAPHICALSH